MCFVGRDRETSQVREALGRGKNVVIVGKHGIGRTSLIEHVAEMTRDQWRFVFADFYRTPAAICGALLDELFPQRRYRRGGAYARYKPSRFKIATRDLEDRRQHVLVLDNIERFTKPKQELVRCLVLAERFQFVAIAAAFAPEGDLLRLRTVLSPAVTVRLGYLTTQRAREYFQHFSERLGFGWNEHWIDLLARETGGYPLGMREAISHAPGQGDQVPRIR
jgi:replication-associated recombination protein RarA